MQTQANAMNSILDAGCIYKRYYIIIAVNGYKSLISPLWRQTNEYSRRLILGTPVHKMRTNIGESYTFAKQFIIRMIDKHLGIAEETKLLHTFLAAVAKVLIVGRPQMGHYTDSGLDYALQGIHFARLADSRFEDTQLRILGQTPYRERNANLRVPRTGRARYAVVGREQLIEPLLDNRLAIAASNTYNIKVTHLGNDSFAMPLGQALHGFQRRRHLQIVCIGLHIVRQLRNNKVAYATTVQLWYIAMSVILLCANCEEKTLFGEGE